MHRFRTFLAESFDEMRHFSVIFVRMDFRIFVRKFLVHLRTVYACPQKLARPLTQLGGTVGCSPLDAIVTAVEGVRLGVVRTVGHEALLL